MKLAIHQNIREGFFTERWIDFCQKNNISYKLVNCYSSDIIEELNDCDGLLWHFAQGSALDYLVAIKLITSVNAAGKKTFPDPNSCWHFDDKVAQKYLLEAINAPLIKSWVFYSKKETLEWISKTTFPKIFKLKGGASSANVLLIKNSREAKKQVKKAFGRGYRQFDRVNLFIYSVKKWQLGKNKLKDVAKDFFKIFVKSDYEKIKGRERGYAYFQEFLPNNSSDIRIIVIGNKAFGIKRMVRKNDFRASGSGHILYGREHIDERCIKIAFNIAKKLNSNCLTFDFLYNESNEPLIAEISYGFVQEGYDDCPGYWDKSMKWIGGRFSAQDWMVEDLITDIQNKRKLHD